MSAFPGVRMAHHAARQEALPTGLHRAHIPSPLTPKIMPPRRNRNVPCQFKTGDRIRAIAMFEHHDYRRDESYEVVHIDTNDQTLQARDENGQVGHWIRWRDCEGADDLGWEWLKGQLPAEALELLSAFDGLGSLKLRADLRVALIQEIPSLKARVLDVCATLDRQRQPDSPR